VLKKKDKKLISKHFFNTEIQEKKTLLPSSLQVDALWCFGQLSLPVQPSVRPAIFGPSLS
jgi:hypothetical protein